MHGIKIRNLRATHSLHFTTEEYLASTHVCMCMCSSIYVHWWGKRWIPLNNIFPNTATSLSKNDLFLTQILELTPSLVIWPVHTYVCARAIYFSFHSIYYVCTKKPISEAGKKRQKHLRFHDMTV